MYIGGNLFQFTSQKVDFWNFRFELQFNTVTKVLVFVWICGGYKVTWVLKSTQIKFVKEYFLAQKIETS